MDKSSGFFLGYSHSLVHHPLSPSPKLAKDRVSLASSIFFSAFRGGAGCYLSISMATPSLQGQMRTPNFQSFPSALQTTAAWGQRPNGEIRQPTTSSQSHPPSPPSARRESWLPIGPTVSPLTERGFRPSNQASSALTPRLRREIR